MSTDRRLYLLVLYICAIQLRSTIGGNPRDSAQVSARNAPNNGTTTSSSSGRSSSNFACQEDVLDQCPPNASCDKGRCVCLFGYKLNPAYHGKNASGSGALPLSSVPSTNVAYPTYCLPDEAGTKAASIYGGGSSSSSSSNSSKATGDAAGGDSGGTTGQLPLREPVGAHHILGGVLIPLAFVVILIGSAILAKRTDLWSRLRQRFLAHRNRHRRRPAYEDVVL
uniref:EB domain-containing protein n=1 Tax=Anopheles dirus TaxID=7168 RepID=A0A182NHM1_9DIPT